MLQCRKNLIFCTAAYIFLAVAEFIPAQAGADWRDGL
jgi:hypothetical protein